MFMFEMRKEYLGTFQTELQAARTYDKVHILVHGIKARTNFSYSKKKVMEILDENSKKSLS